MAFDLASVLADVSESGTDREQIEYIKLDLIDNDPNNFYQLTDISLLADNISLCGLQQPIRVRQQKENPGRYIIVSGHRRRAALEMLVADGHEQWKEAPCIVERDDVSPALQQLRLIYANANTRKMSPAEISEQAEQVEKLLYQLKEEGYDFPGRMRDHVAEAVGASKSKLARLKVIRENLAKCWQSSYKKDKLVESTAYNLAQLPEEWQKLIYSHWRDSIASLHADSVTVFENRLKRISRIKCSRNGRNKECEHGVAIMMDKAVAERWVDPCNGCCCDCLSLRTCKFSCHLAQGKKNQLQSEYRESRRQEAEEKEHRERPITERIRGIYDRVGKARNAAGLTVEDLYRASGRYYTVDVEAKQRRLESGAAKVNENTTLPFGHGFYYSDAKAICDVADALGCSLDYLFCRTDIRETAQPVAPVSESGTWKQGAPENPGTYIVFARYCDGGKRTPDEMEWDGERWMHFGQDVAALGVKVYAWIERPEVEESSSSSLNDSCKTGMSPTGHCGAAAYCAEPYDCCLNCSDPCNSRCGWLNEEA